MDMNIVRILVQTYRLYRFQTRSVHLCSVSQAANTNLPCLSIDLGLICFWLVDLTIDLLYIGKPQSCLKAKYVIFMQSI